MSGSLGTETGGTGSGGMNIAQLIAALSPILLGSGKGTTADQSTGGQSGASTSTTTTGAPSLSDLQTIFEQATANSTNDKATSDIVTNILNQAAIAFGSTKAAGNSAGLYNSTTVQQLADQAEAVATQQAAQTVLNYKTAQQQIAGQAAGTIGQLTASTALKTTTGNTGTQNTAAGTKTTQVASSVPQGQNLLATGVGGVGAYSLVNKLLGSGTDGTTGLADKIGGLFGAPTALTGDNLGAATAALGALNSEPGVVPAIDPGQAAAAVGTLDLSNGPVSITPSDYGIGTTPATNFLTSDLTSSIGDLGGPVADTAATTLTSAADAAQPVVDLTDQVAQSAGDAASSLGDTISTGFSDLGNFFSNLF